MTFIEPDLTGDIERAIGLSFLTHAPDDTPRIAAVELRDQILGIVAGLRARLETVERQREDWKNAWFTDVDDAQPEGGLRVVHVVRVEGPTSEVFAGPFASGEAEAWIEANRTDAWTMCQVAPLERPAVVPERERLVHEDPELAAQIREGIAEAEAGRTVDLGSFAQHLTVDDRMPPGMIAASTPGHVVAYNAQTGRMAETRQDERGQWSTPAPATEEGDDG